MHLMLPLLLACTLLSARPADAHAILVGSDPAASASVAPGTVGFRLRFNSRIDRARSRLSLSQGGQAGAALPVERDGPPDTLAAQASLVGGGYVLHWQVLAIDGHITRGELPFSVSPGLAQIPPPAK